MAIDVTSTFPAHLIDLHPGRPYPSTTTYQDLLYPGEAIFAEQWDPSYGGFLSQPTCSSCGLLLGTTAPSREVGDTVGSIRAALREQNSRISLQVVSRILDGTRDERIDLFIKVVQSSDLSGLANVLDDQVERFLRELLAQP
jgi:hypothetical protein